MQYGEEDENEYRDEPEAEDDYANLSRDNGGENSERAPDHLLAAAGLEDSDAEDDMVRIVFFVHKQLMFIIFYLPYPCSCLLSSDALILINIPLEN